jgi:D-glycero-D-manno-heptose 1,7-bisphosphate phosphatase
MVGTATIPGPGIRARIGDLMSDRKEHYILLGRDGVINRRAVGASVFSWNQFEFLPRVLEALRLLAEHGFTALVVSNQECVGRGLMSAHELRYITSRYLLEVALEAGEIGKVYYCMHTEAEGCTCRMPLPGLLQRAMEEHGLLPAETYMIGSLPEDMEAAARAGCPGILIRREAYQNTESTLEAGYEVAGSLYEGVDRVIQRVSHAQELVGQERTAVQRATGNGEMPRWPKLSRGTSA